MSPLDALFHLLNFLLMPALLAAVAAGLAKLAWPRRLHAVAWIALAGWAAAGALAGHIAGVVSTGREGSMLGYLLMLPGTAAGLAWAGRHGLLARS